MSERQTPPDTPSLVERLRDANAGIEILKALEEAPHCKADLAKAERAIRDGIAHIEAQAAQITALQSTNDHLHEGLAANAKEMADVVGEVGRLRSALEGMVELGSDMLALQAEGACGDPYMECPMQDSHKDGDLKDLVAAARRALNPNPET